MCNKKTLVREVVWKKVTRRDRSKFHERFYGNNLQYQKFPGGKSWKEPMLGVLLELSFLHLLLNLNKQFFQNKVSQTR